MRRSRGWLLTVTCFCVLLVISAMIALNTALGDIARDTLATQAQLTWIVDAYTLALACLLLLGGALGDRYGRRGALITGLVIFGAASLIPVCFDTPTGIIVGRAVTGVGAALVLPATLSLLTGAYPREERNKAVGVWAGVAGAGAIVGFLGAGLLLEVSTWRAIFWAFTAAALALALAAVSIATSRDENGTPIDWAGGVLIGIALAALVLGLVEVPSRGWTDSLVWGCFGVSAATAVLFVVVEMRRRHPLLDVGFFRRADFTAGVIAVMFLFLTTFGYFFLCMQHLQLVMGYGAIKTAIATAPMAVFVLVPGLLTYRILPRFGLRLVLTTGLVLMASGLFWMRYVDVAASYWDLLWPMIVMSSGVGVCTAPATAAITGAVPDDKQGVASAVNDAGREVGAAIGIAVTGSVLAAEYTRAITPNLGDFPEAIRGQASESLALALAIAETLGPAGGSLQLVATSAFVAAMGATATVLAATVAVGAVVVGMWAPGRDGLQFKVIEDWWRPGRHRAGRTDPVSPHGGDAERVAVEGSVLRTELDSLAVGDLHGDLVLSEDSGEPSVADPDRDAMISWLHDDSKRLSPGHSVAGSVNGEDRVGKTAEKPPVDPVRIHGHLDG
ncbi:MFS transporter [Mycolicibacterium phlei]|uniref:MFS transporter n=1 Tax=Mycolicibacterium phlei TaxID=1771 RepID=UPI0037C5829D